MSRQIPLLLALLAVLGLPIFLRPKGLDLGAGAGRTVVIISPHNESIRSELGRAFEAWYQARRGQQVHVDWRTPGGTSEIARYVDSEYVGAFEHYWKDTLHRPWSSAVEASFASRKVTLNADPAQDSVEQQARRAFLDSAVSCKLDLFFGGGAFDFQQASGKGQLVDCGFLKAHPEMFGDGPGQIPKIVGGEAYWDPQGRWIGTAISAFGICYNTDVLKRRGLPSPVTWSDLGSPGYAHGIALANPTQSGSMTKALEMLIQQQMQERVTKARALGDVSPDLEKKAVAEGWSDAMRLLMRIGANARYFTDSSGKISLDVAAGEAAAGMVIDFYGRFESEAVREPDGYSRLQYVDAEGGTSYGVDPIGLFRGAPNADVARDFIDFVMSPEGQKLWNWKVGVAGGPRKYALRRLPVLPALYAPEFRDLRTDPDVNPYELAKKFTYHDAWTGPLFRQIAFVFRVMCIDPHEELQSAWDALSKAQFPVEAMNVFQDVSVVDYAVATGRMRDALGGDKIREVQLAKELADHFRAQYARARELAGGS